MGVLGGGGSNRLPGLVTKQAVEFPQVLASNYNWTNKIILLVYNHACMWTNCGQFSPA